MKSISFNYLDHIRDTKGRHEAYVTFLKTDYYQQKLKEVLDRSNKDVIRAITTSDDNTVRHAKRLYTQLEQTNQSLSEVNSELVEIDDHLTEGLAELSELLGNIENRLYDIHSELGNLSAVMDWGFNAVIEHIRVSNLLLSDIYEASLLPDFEKERVTYIKRGLARQKEALFDSDLYQYALADFDEALKRDPTDYLVYMRVGLIYLFSPTNNNITKARENLEIAQKFLRPKVLLGSESNDAEQLNSHNAIISYYIGMTLMIDGEYQRAADSFVSANKISPDFADALYQLAKAKYKANTPGFVDDLRMLIMKQPLYHLKASFDLDYEHNTDMQLMLRTLFDNRKNPLQAIIDEIDTTVVDGSVFRKEIDTIKLNMQKSYIRLFRADQLLNKERKATFRVATGTHEEDLKRAQVALSSIDHSGKLLTLIAFEAKYQQEISERINLFNSNIKAYRDHLDKMAEEERSKAQKSQIAAEAWRRKERIAQPAILIIMPLLFIAVGRFLHLIIVNELGAVKLGFIIRPTFIYNLLWLVLGWYLSVSLIKIFGKHVDWLRDFRGESAMQICGGLGFGIGLLLFLAKGKSADKFEEFGLNPGTSWGAMFAVLIIFTVAGIIVGKIIERKAGEK